MATPQRKTVPWTPKPLHKDPPREKLVDEHEAPIHPAQIPLAYKQDIPLLIPNFNQLYDSHGTHEAWRFCADEVVSGTVTTIAGSAVISVVTLPTSPQWQLGNWPDGTQLFLVINTFNIGPQTASFLTQGEINVIFIDQFGNNAPLGILPNNDFSNLKPFLLLPGAITDPGNLSLGNLSFTLNSGATIGTYAWQIGFAAAYMLPAIKGYKVERINDERYHDDKHHQHHTHE